MNDYTHYWRQLDNCDQLRWARITAATKLLLAALPATVGDQPLIITREYDTTEEPEVNGERIAFNGWGDLGHETFALTRRMRALRPAEKRPVAYLDNSGELVFTPHVGIFDFCKTAQKPYDLFVCAVLIVANAAAPEIWTISSDGYMRDWVPAWRFVLDTLKPHAKDLGLSWPLRLPERVAAELLKRGS